MGAMFNYRKWQEVEEMKKQEDMYALLLEVLHDLVVYKDPSFNTDINKIIVYV
jgi:hypothetical protein